MTNFNFLCTYIIGCTGEFHQVLSVGGNSFYVGVQRGDGGKTYFYHTSNHYPGSIHPGLEETNSYAVKKAGKCMCVYLCVCACVYSFPVVLLIMGCCHFSNKYYM